jgi:hypothetical protein
MDNGLSGERRDRGQKSASSRSAFELVCLQGDRALIDAGLTDDNPNSFAESVSTALFYPTPEVRDEPLLRSR